ncbi:hypothetical protein GWK48_02755 [Metallosphaera tengchongensis]|uniref:Uncharacterized protein n=1 Tax=Metallosphaera tengchongensis TaxID=1532350 RepID=A0A6N0NRS4_9CREN|nr:hypothetical protein [Metallosphaera tengchongensis]QKQ99455.1 hypothetical protein GWK48_02755 [Metallosphaera tengchongensis]
MKQTRTAILLPTGEVCVFRGNLLEHLFLSLKEFEESRVKMEVNFSNFHVGRGYQGALVEECGRIVQMIKRSLDKPIDKP